jgi:signal transduction histidine kinase/DNA-binding response OmpR family regulator
VAIELRPEAPTSSAAEERFRWIDGLGFAFTAVGVYVYLGLLPWALGAAVWKTRVPQILVYLALDGLLLVRLSARQRGMGGVGWQAAYRCLLLVAILWTATDGIDVLRLAGWLSESAVGLLFDVLWLPPLLVLVLAARVRRLSAGEPVPAVPASGLPGTTVRGSVLLGQALLLPVLHTVLVGLGAWEPGQHPFSWLWAVSVSVASAGLGVAFIRGVEGLAAARARRVVEANQELAASVVALRSARDEAKAAAQAKARFLAAMSHEIRTPMNGVLGNVSLLQRTGLTAAQRRMVDTINRSGQALLAIIDEVLDASRLEAGRVELRSEAFDVGATIEDAVESLGEVARGKGLELAGLVEGLRAPLLGDRGRFRQVLVNLLGNAIKYTERGEVAVFARARSTGEGTVTVAVDVADTGIGIAPDAAERVFEPFGQAAHVSSGGGAGLGLAISRQLARLMGGDIRFESEPGRGSVFRLDVTLGRSQEAEPAPPVPPIRRALVVEARPMSRFVLERQCKELGIGVRSVGDVDAALAALRDAAAGGGAYEAVLVASDLLDAGRAAFLERLRKDGATAHVRVIVVGAPAGPVPPDEAASVLPRPVLRHSLLEALTPPSGAGERSRRSPASPPKPPRRGRLALVVEDNPVNQAVAEGMLGLIGFDVHLAADGASALARLDEGRYDVVLMDCLLPGLDGLETTAELRRRESAAGREPTPVVALTANAMAGDRERCLAAGMDDYLSKPLAIETLEATLDRVLGKSAATRVPAGAA